MSTSVPKYKAKRERKLKKPKKTITPSSGKQPPISILERERIEKKEDHFIKLKDIWSFQI